MSLLALNVGSSSLKAALYRRGEATPVFRLDVDLRTGQVQSGEGLPEALTRWEERWPAAEVALRIVAEVRRSPEDPLTVCSHRVVHGGDRTGPAVIDDALLMTLHRLAPLCPLHQPPALAVIDSLRRSSPDLPQVAAFDTAFHSGQPALWREYALPEALRQQGIRSYGFHGLSCQSILRQLAAMDPALAAGRVVIAHLGNGSSLTAVRDGRSQATTMGFSPLEGVPMGTRWGRLDPGVLLYLLERDWTTESLTRLLYRESGLRGLSGISGDMRELMTSPAPQAAFAIDYYADRVAREIASLATVLGGLETLVFTGGIGEHQPEVRARILARLAWIRVTLNETANRSGAVDIAGSDSRIRVLALHTDEQDELRRAGESLVV